MERRIGEYADQICESSDSFETKITTDTDSYVLIVEKFESDTDFESVTYTTESLGNF